MDITCVASSVLYKNTTINNLVNMYFPIMGDSYLQNKFLEMKKMGWRVNVCSVLGVIKLYFIEVLSFWIPTSSIWDSLSAVVRV
jgi:hypothetical protein